MQKNNIQFTIIKKQIKKYTLQCYRECFKWVDTYYLKFMDLFLLPINNTKRAK